MHIIVIIAYTLTHIHYIHLHIHTFISLYIYIIGIVSFDEWQEFLTQQKLKEAEKTKAAASTTGSSGSGGGGQNYNDLLNQLYEQSYQSDGFNTLNKNMASGQRGGQRRDRAIAN